MAKNSLKFLKIKIDYDGVSNGEMYDFPEGMPHLSMLWIMGIF